MPTDTGRTTLVDLVLKERVAGQPAKETVFENEEQRDATLRSVFGIHF